MNPQQLMYGGVPVPYTVSWTGEEKLLLGRCSYAENRLAICQIDRRGEGKPAFAKPHMGRQREAIGKDLCDLCGKPLKNRTKVSLSQSRPQLHAATAGDILQVEPLLHKECAKICFQHCPALKHQAQTGRLMVRQVFRWQCQLALYSAEGTFEAVGVKVLSVAHAKVHLMKFKDMSIDWIANG